MNDSNDNDKDSSPLPPLWSTDHQFDTPSKGAKIPSLPFAGTAPPQVTDDHSPETLEAFRDASASSTKKTDTSDDSKDSLVNGNGKFVFSAAGIDDLFDEAAEMDDVDHIAVDDLMGPASPPLASLKNDEETSTEDSPPKKEARPSRDSPDTKSTGSGSSTDMWQTQFEKLKEYKKVHGNCKVPQKYGPLGVWVNKQRNEYNKYNNRKKGMKPQLTLERISQLNSIGFTWAKAYGQELWEMKFDELKEYKKKVSRGRPHTWSVD